MIGSSKRHDGREGDLLVAELCKLVREGVKFDYSFKKERGETNWGDALVRKRSGRLRGTAEGNSRGIKEISRSHSSSEDSAKKKRFDAARERRENCRETKGRVALKTQRSL